MSQKPSVTVAHLLPGRLRLRLSHCLRSPGRTMRGLRKQAGIESADYNRVSRSLLIRFDPREVPGDKVIMRAALCLSLDHGRIPVRIFPKQQDHEWSDSPFHSGLVLMAALAARAVRLEPRTSLAMEWFAGLSTFGAVLHHGWTEYRRHGHYDPEVLSVVYLATAFLRGQVLTASLMTWLTTFGRHFWKPPARGMELRVTHMDEDSAGFNRYGVILSSGRDQGDSPKFSRLLPAVLQYALMGVTGSDEGTWLSDVRDVIVMRDSVLEDRGPARNMPALLSGQMAETA